MTPIAQLLDTDPRALDARVEEALRQHGAECEVRRRTWWYTSRPAVHEALLIPLRGPASRPAVTPQISGR